MPEKVPEDAYARAYVRRRFEVSERQLRNWERQELIPVAENYSFSDLIAIQTLVKLRENRIQTPQIGRALKSLRKKLSWIEQPLSELRIVSDGRKIAVYVAGQKMEAVSGQILFDFEAAELAGVKAFPGGKSARNLIREGEAWFQTGLDLEETGAPVEQAIEAYRKAIELNPGAAGALVNLGTIYYRLRKFGEAEKYYVQAVAADPGYPLAEFNLGNLYDEQNRVGEALHHYRKALELSPGYADAHFNMALIRERVGDPLQAVHHWKAYLKLDRAGKWAEIARRQLERLRQATVIRTS
ncbi:MAG: tetratricopeptide repeat protein [Bryobacteraceae bacterium]